MSGTAKISISIADRDLLAWARRRGKKTGKSLSALFTEAIRLERQMDAREVFLEAEGPDGRATPDEMAAIRAEWGARMAPRRPTLKTRPVAVARSRAASKRAR